MVNPLRQPREIHIEGADDDAGVPGPVLMQPDEVAPVQRHHRAMLAGRELQDVGVRHSLTGMPAVPHRQHVVSQATKFDRYWLRQILVCEEPLRDYAASCAAICSAISGAWSWA
jgi:hypothetical protein